MPPPSGGSSGGCPAVWSISHHKGYCSRLSTVELPEFDPKNLPEWAEEFAGFLLLTGQSDVDVATKCSLL